MSAKSRFTEARVDHQVGHAAHAHVQHVVGHLERLGEGRALIGQPEQVLVRDDDQRVDELLQLLDARHRPPSSASGPSKSKGLVTTPTVRMPRSRAMRAMTGAAPVPGAAAHARR
jgi:hypothetical protein